MMHRDLAQQRGCGTHSTNDDRCAAATVLHSRRLLLALGACVLVVLVTAGLTIRDNPARHTMSTSTHTPLEVSATSRTNVGLIEAAVQSTQSRSQFLGESTPMDAFGNEAQNETEEEEPEHHRCASLPRTQSKLHSWLKYEADAALALLHSITAALALLIIPANTTTRSATPSACGLALSPQEVVLRDHRGRSRRAVQEGLFFDADAESFWTMQRPTHALQHHKDGHEGQKPVWLAGISNGDCLVCTLKSDCAGLAQAQQQIRKTMAHAPEGWGSVHVHECQEQEQVYLPHPPQRWKNECVYICLAAYGPQAVRLDQSELQALDPESMAWLACQICQQMDVQVDVAGEVDIKQTEASGKQLEKDRVQADRMMSKLFHAAAAPPEDELWPTSRLAPSLGSWSAGSLQQQSHGPRDDLSPEQAVRAFFLDWTGDLTGVSELVAAAISEPEALRHLFATTHNRTSEGHAWTSKERFAFADQLPFRRASPVGGGDSDLYDIDSAFVQTALNRIIHAGEKDLPRERHSRGGRIVKLGGGGGGGMGLQLQCLTEDDTADAGEATPLLSVGGGGGGGYRSLHHAHDSIESSFFNGGAGGGAGFQSWGLMDPELPTADGGLTVGGGGGGGVRLQLARRYKHSMKMREGRVLSHKHGASPDELIALPAEHGPTEFSQFPSLLARRMRACMATPGSKLIVRGAGGAGGGMKLSILDALRAGVSQSVADARTRSTTKLRHSVNLKLSYEFNTCGWDRSTAPCAEMRAFPDRQAATRMRIAMQTRQKIEAVRSGASRSLALLEHPLRNASTRGPGGAWSGEMQRQLALCVAESRDLSRQWTAEHESSPSNSTVEGAPSVVPRKVAFDDLLCTCFFSAFGSRPANSSIAPTESAGHGDRHSWMLPSFCRRKEKRKNELARIRGKVPDHDQLMHEAPAHMIMSAQN